MMSRHPERIWATGFVAIVFGLVVLFYGQQQTRTAQKEAKAEAIRCVVGFVSETVEATEARSDAATARDEALVGSKLALRELIRLRVLEQISDGEQVRQAAEQYMVQTQKFVDASQRLQAARRLNPVPDPAQVEACK